MLYKSLKTVIPVAQADSIFSAADADGSRSLDTDEMQELWVSLGDATAARNADRRILKMLQKEPANPNAPDAPDKAEVSLEQFRTWCQNNMPSATMSLTIFAIQTLALLLKQNGLFGWGNILNLDAESATGSCLAPSSMLGLSTKLFFVLLSPAIASVTVLIAYLLLKYDTGTFELTMAPHHLFRACVQILLLSYAPLTRRAVSMLICRPGIDRSYTVFGGWLNDDMSYECFVGGHQNGWLSALSVFHCKSALCGCSCSEPSVGWRHSELL
jgi:hypothetical protein